MTKEERNAYNREHYRKNKEKYLERNARRRFEMRMWIIGQKMNPCMDCGIEYPYYCMDFDHRDPSKKIREVNSSYTRGWKILKREVKKCDLVCSNCHRIRTQAGRLPKIYYRRRGKTPEWLQEIIDTLYGENGAG